MVKENNDKAWTSRSTGLQGLENNEPGPKQGIHSPQNRGHDICTVWLQNCSGKTNCCELCSFWTWMIMVVIQFLSPLLFAEFGINNTSFCFTELLAKRKHKKKKNTLRFWTLSLIQRLRWQFEVVSLGKELMRRFYVRRRGQVRLLDYITLKMLQNPPVIKLCIQAHQCQAWTFAFLW